VSDIGDIASILMLNGGGSLPRKGDNPVLEALIDGALKKSQEPGFFSREAGQKRRAWLDETVNYFTPPELRGPLGLINEANPVTSMERASTASQTMLAPETSGWGRVAAGGDMLSNMAGVVAPAMVAGKAGMPAVNAIEEGLLGWSPGMPAAAGNFMADEFGGMKLPGVSIEDTLRAKYPDAKISITESPRGLVLNRIELPRGKRGQGVGTNIMSDLMTEADARGATVALSPSGDFGGSVPRLKEFYSRFGFLPNKGRTADYGISESMYRLPKEPATPSRPISGTAAHPGGPLNSIRGAKQ